jgi:hypothetical protein
VRVEINVHGQRIVKSVHLEITRTHHDTRTFDNGTSAINLYLSTVQEVFQQSPNSNYYGPFPQTCYFLHVGTLTSAPPFRMCSRFCLEWQLGARCWPSLVPYQPNQPFKTSCTNTFLKRMASRSVDMDVEERPSPPKETTNTKNLEEWNIPTNLHFLGGERLHWSTPAEY